ncbi:LptE family protein [Ichthyenterobacterium sp. W332]|uniref:LptE family protein n=1 Tax=Microcosmobacter mediterraneus TaxID=3075607 RepID=A0ABU2YN58_9FLAO|nr:LptE family protein [Ichthyenterobacterium sp. W332]MDT0559598.1 LptE family protein [Ichthyenterobacterium sp. W332]
MKRVYKYLTIGLCLVLLGCGAYSFTGVQNIDAETFQVNYFQNNAALIEPELDREFTLALQNLIQNQTNLSLVNSGGDLTYEGEITEYRISPTTATADSRAAQNRLSVSVNVRFFHKNDEEQDFEERFSFFYDFEGDTQLIGSERDTAWEEIFERLTQDIFNRSLANW